MSGQTVDRADPVLQDGYLRLRLRLRRRDGGQTSRVSLVALPALARLARYGDVRSRGGDEVASIFRLLALRAGAGLPNAELGLAGDAAEVIQKSAAKADSAVRLLADEQATGDWLAALHALDGTEQAHPLLYGDAVRRLRDHGQLGTEAVEERMRLALSPALLSLLDGWVVSLPPEAFDIVLPALRRSLSRFEASQRRSVGERLRGTSPQGTVQQVNDDLGMLPPSRSP